VLDVYGASDYGPASEMGRQRLITIRRRGARRGGSADEGGEALVEGADLRSLVGHFVSELGSSDRELLQPARRHRGPSHRRLGAAGTRGATLAELLSEQVVRHVFLKQFRDAEHGELAVLQQVVEARSSVSPGSLRWRRLRGSYDLSVNQLASHPLADELGLAPEQTIRLAFAAEFGFRMEPGVVRWPVG
jgi:hypothetical protein